MAARFNYKFKLQSGAIYFWVADRISDKTNSGVTFAVIRQRRHSAAFVAVTDAVATAMCFRVVCPLASLFFVV
jgi:hypothetical protein